MLYGREREAEPVWFLVPLWSPADLRFSPSCCTTLISHPQKFRLPSDKVALGAAVLAGWRSLGWRPATETAGVASCCTSADELYLRLLCVCVCVFILILLD